MTMMSDSTGTEVTDLDDLPGRTTEVLPVIETTSLHEALGRVGDAPQHRPAVAPGDDFVQMACPGCGVGYSGPRPTRNSARSFCVGCDYPLFLVVAPKPAPVEESALGKRRLPGVDGKDQLGGMPCPSCAEPNLPNPEGACTRCGEALFPEPAVEPESVAIPLVDVISVYRSHYWWIISTVTLGVLLAATSTALYWVW